MKPRTHTATLTVPVRLNSSFDLGQEQPVTLLIYHPDRVDAVTLDSGRGKVFGRSVAADVPVQHPSLSREHARFEIVDHEVWVEDLGSTNGTRVNGEVTSRCVVSPGDDVVLGAVPISVHLRSPMEGQIKGLCSHDRFLHILDEELLRHRVFENKLGLLLIRAPRGKSGQISSWCPAVQKLLRPVDRMALYSRAAIEVLLPVMSRELLAQVARAVTEAHPGLLCGAALFPDAATSGGELLDAARSAAQQATRKEPVRFAEAIASRALAGGEDAVVLSPEMRKLFAVVERMRSASIPVLICGETGTGKEVVARAIYGERPGAPLETPVPLPCINCAAIPDQLIESIMFGHEKGAFTGADRQTRGVFEDADGGAVLLDEIGELSPAAQAALLRVLDTKRITRVGSTREIEVNVRILAATHRNLEAMCAAGSFRRDLLYRINTMTLKVPPLRARVEEIEPLAMRFLTEANEANGCGVSGFEPEALDVLRGHDWPGNVRELRNVIHRAVVMAEDTEIRVQDLPERIFSRPRVSPAAGLDAAPPEVDAGEDIDYKMRVQRYEIGLLSAALEKTGWSKTRTSQLLRIPLRTLIYKIKAFDLTPKNH